MKKLVAVFIIMCVILALCIFGFFAVNGLPIGNDPAPGETASTQNGGNRSGTSTDDPTSSESSRIFTDLSDMGPGSVEVNPSVSAVESPTLDPSMFTQVTHDLYNSNGSLGTLAIPSLDLSVQVFEGTDNAVLAKGAGHFEETSAWSGNVCIAGHNRGTNCYFGDIHTLNEGDTIVFTTRLGTRTYSVVSVEKVHELDRSGLAATDFNMITLYTCTRNESEYRWCVKGVEVV